MFQSFNDLTHSQVNDLNAIIPTIGYKHRFIRTQTNIHYLAVMDIFQFPNFLHGIQRPDFNTAIYMTTVKVTVGEGKVKREAT